MMTSTSLSNTERNDFVAIRVTSDTRPHRTEITASSSLRYSIRTGEKSIPVIGTYVRNLLEVHTTPPAMWRFAMLQDLPRKCAIIATDKRRARDRRYRQGD